MSAKIAMEELNYKLKRLNEEREVVRKQLFNEGCKEIFDKFPDLQSFSWTQYTPWFNDGDPCHFWCNCEELYIVYNEDEYEYVCRKDESDVGQIYMMTQELFDLLLEEDFEEMFGDHVRVTVKKTGVETNEYDHD